MWGKHKLYYDTFIPKNGHTVTVNEVILDLCHCNALMVHEGIVQS